METLQASALELSGIALSEGDAHRALEMADHAVREQDSVWARLARGKALQSLGRSLDAEDSYASAAFSQSPFLYAAYELGLSALARGDMVRFREALSVDMSAADEVSLGWFEGPMLFLMAVEALIAREPERADLLAMRAIDLEKQIPELKIIQYVEQNLDTCDCTFSTYSRGLLEASRRQINYADELARLPASTAFLEVGGMDGISFDTLHPFAKQWSGFILEPVSEFFEQLKQNYCLYPNVKPVQVAISNFTGERHINRIKSSAIESGAVGLWARGVSSFSEAHNRHFSEHVAEETVRCMTFQDFVLEHQVSRFEVLQIDTEGHDWIVLSQIDLDAFGVEVAQIELLGLSLEDRLNMMLHVQNRGFEFSLTANDICAVRR